MYQIEIKQRALVMMQDAYDWYENEKKGLGEEFISILDSVYEKISNHPEYFGLILKNYRQIKLPRFPFVVVYEIIERKVVVFAVFHTARNSTKKF